MSRRGTRASEVVESMKCPSGEGKAIVCMGRLSFSTDGKVNWNLTGRSLDPDDHRKYDLLLKMHLPESTNPRRAVNFLGDSECKPPPEVDVKPSETKETHFNISDVFAQKFNFEEPISTKEKVADKNFEPPDVFACGGFVDEEPEPVKKPSITSNDAAFEPPDVFGFSGFVNEQPDPPKQMSPETKDDTFEPPDVFASMGTHVEEIQESTCNNEINAFYSNAATNEELERTPSDRAIKTNTPIGTPIAKLTPNPSDSKPTSPLEIIGNEQKLSANVKKSKSRAPNKSKIVKNIPSKIKVDDTQNEKIKERQRGKRAVKKKETQKKCSKEDSSMERRKSKKVVKSRVKERKTNKNIAIKPSESSKSIGTPADSPLADPGEFSFKQSFLKLKQTSMEGNCEGRKKSTGKKKEQNKRASVKENPALPKNLRNLVIFPQALVKRLVKELNPGEIRLAKKAVAEMSVVMQVILHKIIVHTVASLAQNTRITQVHVKEGMDKNVELSLLSHQMRVQVTDKDITY